MVTKHPVKLIDFLKVSFIIIFKLEVSFNIVETNAKYILGRMWLILQIIKLKFKEKNNIITCKSFSLLDASHLFYYLLIM